MRFILLQSGMIAAGLAAAIGVSGCSHKSDDNAAGAAAADTTACGSTDDSSGTDPDAPDDIACSGLYTDVASKTLAPNVRPFAPAIALWSDGADKSRFIQLPEGATIDASNMDDWTFPVGTKVWKEFRHGDHRIETRFFWKQKADRWVQAAYVWSDDGNHANRGEGKQLTVDGQPYSVPKNVDCDACHRGRKDKLLGFEALSLAQPEASGVTLAVLAGEKRINPVPPKTTLSLPQRGIGVLHVNCGVTCHNNNPNATARGTGLYMRLAYDDVVNKPVEQWDTIKTAVGVASKTPAYDGETRVTPSDPDSSLIVKVMSTRGQGQMPPLATNVVDDVGLASVEAWIRSLPAPVVTGSVAPLK
jgi:hypothetical protein